VKGFFSKISSNQIVSLLLDPPYLSFSLSVFFSQIAFNMLTIVLIFLIFFLTSSNFSVSILLFCILIPQILLSFIGGIVADVSNRKQILVAANLLRAGALLLLFFNLNSVLMVYAVALVISVISQFYVPAESPMIPSLVRKEKLVPANSIFGMGLFGSILIGYVLAGPAISALGRSNVFILLAFIFLLAAVFAFLIPSEKIRQKNKTQKLLVYSSFKKSLRDGLSRSSSILIKYKEVGDAFFLLIFSQIIILIIATLIPGYAKTILEVPAEDLSVILFAPASLGMVISATLIGSFFAKSVKKNLINAGILISGISLLLFPLASRIVVQDIVQFLNLFLPRMVELNVFNFVLVLAFLAGFANALIFVPSQALVQGMVPQDFRSKIYGLLFALIGVFSLLPILVAGGVADIIGVGAVLAIIGAAILFLGLIRAGIR
jgi:MFS family permease